MIRLFGRLLIAATLFWVATGTRAAPGDLDVTSFGSGTGKVITAIGSNNDLVSAVALQPDGKIVVAGSCLNGANNDFCIARFLPGGALDTSFNATGKVITAIGPGNDSASAVAIQPDGKIVVAGYCSNGSNNDFCIARYLASGALDTSFNSTGTVITPIGTSNDLAIAVALQPDGKIVIAGFCFDASTRNSCLARYLANGALDTSFNSTGTVVSPVGSSASLALQPDGKIVAAGPCYNGVNNDFCLARYLTNGALDASFNTTGAVVTAVGPSDDNASAVAIQVDGKIVVAGACSNGVNSDFCLARYHPDGTLDASFNATGTVMTAIGPGNDVASGLALQPDGKIVVAGTCSNGSNNDFCLTRYLANGALDASFNANGKVITDISSSPDNATTLALQPDGKMVVAGYCFGGSNYDFCLARYQGGPIEARNCSMDIDGDNQMIATTDGLIITRVMLGITGNAVLNGITFAPYATRTNWPQIRDYLVTQCGMSIIP